MHSQALTLGNLPEDPPVVDGLKLVKIKKGDYRKGLVPKQVSCAGAIALKLALTPACLFCSCLGSITVDHMLCRIMIFVGSSHDSWNVVTCISGQSASTHIACMCSELS